LTETVRTFYFLSVTVWRDRSLLGLVSAELVSLTGSAMTFVALPWFVFVTTGSPARTGWVLAAEMAPMAVLGIPAGTLVARLGAKRTMLLCDASRAPLMTVIPILYWTQRVSFVAVLAATFAVGCFSAPYFTSSRLVVPEVAGEDERAVAGVNAILAGANQLTQIAGPVLAGLLIAATTPAAVLCVDGATYAFSFAVILLSVRVGKRVEPTEESRGVLAGIRFLIGDSLLGPLLLAACAINFAAQGLIVGVQGLAYVSYGVDAHALGFLFGGFGIGALLGALTAQQLTQRTSLAKLAALAILGMPLPVFLLGIAMPWPAAAVVLASFGFFVPLTNAPIIGILTVRTPAALRPKVMSAVMTIATLAGPLGFVGAGQLLEHVAVTTLFLVVAAGLLVAAAAFAGVLLRNGRSADPSVAVPA
jgi:MFS family permease